MFERPETDTDINEVGRALGHDLYLYFYRCRSHDEPDPHDRQPRPRAWPPSVAEGFEQARARGLKRQAPDRFERKWLQLRMGALERGRVVAPDVTPALLREIDVAHCPVTRVALTHGERLDSDWSIDRLNNEGAYARNNLAVMSTRANRAKGALDYEAVHGRAQRHGATDGLSPLEWLRLAALMLGPCFVARPGQAPAIPLAAPMPTRTARPAIQMVQHVLTTLALPAAGKNALIKHFRPACADEASRVRFALLAEAVHQGMKGLVYRHDVWLKPGVMAALLRWRETMTDRAWGVAGEVARRLTGSSLVPGRRLESWRIEARGYMQPGKRPGGGTTLGTTSPASRMALGAAP